MAPRINGLTISLDVDDLMHLCQIPYEAFVTSHPRLERGKVLFDVVRTDGEQLILRNGHKGHDAQQGTPLCHIELGTILEVPTED